MRLRPRAKAAGLLAARSNAGPVLVLPAFAALLLGMALLQARDLEQARAILFLCGPLVLLAGLHPRLGAFLHDGARIAAIHLPLAPKQHFRAATPRHLLGILATMVFSVLAVLLATGGRSPELAVLLGCELTWLLLLSAIIEPLVSGISAWLGRRLPLHSRGANLQAQLSGGLTLPETAVHLWAPALGLGLAAALAMPGQLLLGQTLAQGRNPSLHELGSWFGLPLASALVLRALAKPLYARGMWEAVPWLAQAERTLSGPPKPPPAPAWLLRLGNPRLQLALLQWLRLTPVPLLRLVLVLATAAVLALRGRPPSPAALAWSLFVLGLWFGPQVQGGARGKASFAALPSLPLAPSPWPVVLLLLPGLCLLAVLSWKLVLA